jgi:hypothetical protein
MRTVSITSAGVTRVLPSNEPVFAGPFESVVEPATGVIFQRVGRHVPAMQRNRARMTGTLLPGRYDWVPVTVVPMPTSEGDILAPVRATLGGIPGGRRPVAWTFAEVDQQAKSLGMQFIRDYFTVRANPNPDRAAREQAQADRIRGHLTAGTGVVVTVTCPLKGDPEHGWPGANLQSLAERIHRLIDPRAIVTLINEPEHADYWPGNDWRRANLVAIELARHLKSLDPKRLLATPSPTTKDDRFLLTWGQHLLDNGASGLFDFVDVHYYTSSRDYLARSLAAHNQIAQRLNAKVMTSEFSIGNAELGNQPMSVFTDVLTLVTRHTDLCCFWMLNRSDTPKYVNHTHLLDRDGQITELGREWRRVVGR